MSSTLNYFCQNFAQEPFLHMIMTCVLRCWPGKRTNSSTRYQFCAIIRHPLILTHRRRFDLQTNTSMSTYALLGCAFALSTMTAGCSMPLLDNSANKLVSYTLMLIAADFLSTYQQDSRYLQLQDRRAVANVLTKFLAKDGSGVP